MKVVFFGTPAFSVPSLKKLIEADNIEVLALITQPDKAVGRKQVITPPPTKVLAEEHGIPVFQPEKLNAVIASEASQSSPNESMIDTLRRFNPDFIVTCAYGQILKKNILDIAPVINVHASLLPEYRGPAPINWMLIHGETRVGVTTMLSDEGIDTGDILLKSEIEIDENTKADKLTETLSELGSELLIKTLNEFKAIKPEKQSHSPNPEKTLAPFMDKKLGEINFSAETFTLGSANPKQAEFKIVMKNSAKNIHNLIRGTYPWPGAYFMRNGEKIIITDSEVCHRETHEVSRGDLHANNFRAGQITSINKQDGSFNIQTQDGELSIKKLKAQNKSELQSVSWLNGHRLHLGDLVKN